MTKIPDTQNWGKAEFIWLSLRISRQLGSCRMAYFLLLSVQTLAVVSWLGWVMPNCLTQPRVSFMDGPGGVILESKMILDPVNLPIDIQYHHLLIHCLHTISSELVTVIISRQQITRYLLIICWWLAKLGFQCSKVISECSHILCQVTSCGCVFFLIKKKISGYSRWRNKQILLLSCWVKPAPDFVI